MTETMLSFSNKNILLCVTGGIAAYKAAEIIRLFKKDGAHVRVIMTASAKEFITPLTLQAVSDAIDPQLMLASINVILSSCGRHLTSLMSVIPLRSSIEMKVHGATQRSSFLKAEHFSLAA